MNNQGHRGTRSAFLVVTSIVVAIALLNLALPRKFVLVAVNYITWLPVAGGVLWSLATLAALFGCRKLAARPGADTWADLACGAVLMLVLASFPLLRTSQPTLQGDGELGYKATAGHANLREQLPEILARYNPFDFHSPTCSPAERNYALDQAAIFDGMLFGALTAICAFLFLRVMAEPPLIRLGALLLVVTAPPLAGAYGHFDGYAESAFFQLLAWGALYSAWTRGWTKKSAALVAGLLLLAMWVHPLNVLLAAYAFYAAFYAKVVLPRVKSERRRALVTVACALVLAAMPLLSDSNAFSNKLQRVSAAMYRTSFLWSFIHLKASCFLVAALPALALFIWLASGRKPGVFASESPLVNLAGFAVVNAAALVFTLDIYLGIGDEFLFGLLGVIVLAASLILVLSSREEATRRGVILFAILSLYLQIPRLIVNQGDALWERYNDLFPADPCLQNIRQTPYLRLGLLTPIDRPKDRERRLRAFEEGMHATYDRWPEQQVNNMVFFTGWAYEFGEFDRGRAALRQLMLKNPQVLPVLWQPDAVYTYRYSNTAYKVIRAESAQMLMDLVQHDAPPGQVEIYRALLHALRAAEAAQAK